MRVLHIGNIANNAYNNAKFLRRKGIEADVLCYDYRHVMGQPEWEDAEFDGQPDEFSPRWEELDLGSFRRPAWFFQDEIHTAVRRRKPLFRGQFHLERFARHPSLIGCAMVAYWRGRASGSVPTPHLLDILRTYHVRQHFEGWYSGYDIIQAYATEPIHAWMFGGGRPYIAFEHGTMRDIPFEGSPRGRLLSLAYRKANKVVITNPDVIGAAKKLGLKNVQFIPHPIDETKYCPRTSDLREQLQNRYQTEFILFAPSRHNWALKGNDLLLRAYARFIKSVFLKPVLILSEWGQEMEQSRRLIQDLGISRSIIWTPPLNKAKLITYYNAADVVLDQFTIGTFGTVTPEAMACAKPVVLHFDRQVHEWCYAEMPPVVTARNEEEIYYRLMDLAGDAASRFSIGQSSREWIAKYHGWELVADRQIAVYREALQR